MRLVSEAQVAELAERLSGHTGFRMASVATANDSFDFARTGAALVDRAVAFSSPDGVRLAGLGTAWRASTSGANRFQDLKAALSGLAGSGIRAFVGFSFLDEPGTGSVWRGYSAAEAFVPRIGIEGSDSGAIITVCVPDGDSPDPTLELLASMRTPEWSAGIDLGDHATEAHPPVSVWKGQVESALKEIEAGEVTKVVLARSVLVQSAEPPAILRMFRELVRSYPQCFNFAWKSGDAVFMGASPELLASVESGHFHANPLAGSAPRGEGSDEDDLIGSTLLSSEKDRREHELVVTDMTERLAPIMADVSASGEPSLKKMASVQHLSSEIRGTVLPGVGLLDTIDAVHPTPAVGGVPRQAALDLIGSTEDIDRGWYTGGLGWIDANGDGAVAIGLRCGLIRGTTTHLFAGAGIVEGSKPDLELEETRLKFAPLLRLLTAS
jgi:menaquinone-specific isochorismate synthase